MEAEEDTPLPRVSVYGPPVGGVTSLNHDFPRLTVPFQLIIITVLSFNREDSFNSAATYSHDIERENTVSPRQMTL